MRITIADRNATYRRTMILLLQSKSSLEVVSEARDKDDLLLQIAEFDPELVILDGDLSGWDTCDLIDDIRLINQNLGLIIMDGRPQIEVSALMMGADAFYLKGTPSRYLFTAIEFVRLSRDIN